MLIHPPPHTDTRRRGQPHAWRRSLDHDLAVALLGARLELGLTQEDVALRAGISKSYLSRLEWAQRAPRAGTVIRLARVLHLDSDVVDRLLEVAEGDWDWQMTTETPAPTPETFLTGD